MIHWHTEEAFGSHPESLGIIIIRDLPASYVTQREKLLKLAYKFANLDESTREKYTDPASSYRYVIVIASFSIFSHWFQLRMVSWKGVYFR